MARHFFTPAILLFVFLIISHRANAAQDWSTWRGPFGNGSAPDIDVPVTNDPARIRLVWKSADVIPATGSTRYSYGRGGGWIQGGYASPIVAEGRVFLAYYVPAGLTNYDVTGQDIPVVGSNQADDLVHAFDAQTGATHWIRRFEREGITYDRNKSGGHFTCTVWNGLVYAVGSAGKIYCLSTEDGETVWIGDIGPVHESMKKRQDSSSSGLSINGCPVVTDGVLSLNDSNGGLIGFDAKTGQKLWGPISFVSRSPRGTIGISLTWRHGGREYIIAGECCIEPRSGKVLWRIPDAHCYNAPAIHEDYYVCRALRKPGSKEFYKGLTCYKISPTGYELIWSLEPTYCGSLGDEGPFGSDLIHRGAVYAGCINVDFEKPNAKVKDKHPFIMVDLNTGTILKETVYRYPMGYGPAAVNGVIIGGGTFQPSLISADAEHFGKVQKWPVDFGKNTSPAVVGTRVYLRGSKNMYCYDLALK